MQQLVQKCLGSASLGPSRDILELLGTLLGPGNTWEPTEETEGACCCHVMLRTR